jgi:hypothetical protein
MPTLARERVGVLGRAAVRCRAASNTRQPQTNRPQSPDPRSGIGRPTMDEGNAAPRPTALNLSSPALEARQAPQEAFWRVRRAGGWLDPSRATKRPSERAAIDGLKGLRNAYARARVGEAQSARARSL